MHLWTSLWQQPEQRCTRMHDGKYLASGGRVGWSFRMSIISSRTAHFVLTTAASISVKNFFRYSFSFAIVYFSFVFFFMCASLYLFLKVCFALNLIINKKIKIVKADYYDSFIIINFFNFFFD